MDVVGAPEFRAQVLYVLHKLTAGVPELSPDEAMTVALRGLTERDLRFMELVTDEDVLLLNACLMVEELCRREEWATLERLLALCQFSDGTLAERVAALPDRTFASAVTDLYALGWVTTTKED